MKRLIHLGAVATFVTAILMSSFTPAVSAAFSPNLIIDDTVFNDTVSMGTPQINAFLNSKPNSCISPNSGFEAREPNGYSKNGGFTYGDFTSAGQVIATASYIYGLNPQVLLVTLEKEQSLVTGRNSTTYCTGGTEHKYAAATGYGCPDSGGSYSWTGVSLYRRNGVERTATGSTCVNTAVKAGFSQQVIRAAWLLKFGQQRSLGNTNWAVIQGSWNNSDDLQACYGGPMTQGALKRCPNDTPVFYDGYVTIDSTAVHMDTGATAALYWYTPHFHGNQNFVSLFESWFGSTISAGYYSCGLQGANVTGAPTGERVLANQLAPGIPTNLSLVIPNNTGSKCIEAHTWTGPMQQWINHVATNRPAISPADADIISADTNGDGRDELMTVEYRNTSSGLIEIHIWDGSYQHWAAHIATSHPAIDPADSEVIPADTNGDGKDELYLVRYRNNGSGMIEVHGWMSNFQNYFLHTTTNHVAVDPADNAVIAADTNGDHKDEFLLVKYRNNGSGMIEVHGWSSTFQTWVSHIATNHPALDPADSGVISYDSNADGRDELGLIRYRNTASGRVELHGWTGNLQGWVSHIAAVP